MFEDYEPYEKINGIVVSYRNKKTGKIISSLEFEMLKIKKLFMGGESK
jgi:plasmid replication initiation protein